MTPIDEAMSQLNLSIAQPTAFTQVPPLILRLATVTIASQTVTAGPSQRSRGGSGGRGGGFGGGGGSGGGGGGSGGGGGGGGRGQQAAAAAPNPPRNGLKGVPPTIF
jgi:hypothetical protein